jgi:hypothetical protein
MTRDRLLRADELGIRLEIVDGLAIWEAQPLYRHQMRTVAAQQIALTGGCRLSI